MLNYFENRKVIPLLTMQILFLFREKIELITINLIAIKMQVSVVVWYSALGLSSLLSCLHLKQLRIDFFLIVVTNFLLV